MIKKLGLIAGALVVVLVVIVFIVFLSIDSIAKAAIERGSTYALGVKTTLGSADVGIFSGEFTMKHLEVANPEGFDSAHFMQLGEGFVSVTLKSLREDTVEVPKLSLTGIDMNLEKRNGKANYKVITDNLQRFESEDTGGGSTGGAEPAEPAKKFVVGEILIRDVNVHVDLVPEGGALTKMEVPIDEIRLTEVGNEGLTTGQLTNVIMKMLMAAIVKNGADLPADLVNDIGGSLAKLGGLGNVDVSGAAEQAGKVVEGLGKSGEDVGKAIGEGLGGLLGGKKK